MRASWIAASALATAVLMVALSPGALAQPGPAPGQAPLGFAVTHATGKVEQVLADPAGAAAGATQPASAMNETGTALYVVCWQAYEDGVDVPGCDAWFTPPPDLGERRSPRTNMTANVTNPVPKTVDNATAVAKTAVDALEGTVAEPSSGPSQLARVLEAVLAFVQGLLGAVGRGVSATAAGLRDAAASWGGSLADLGGAVWAGVQAGVQGVLGATDAVARAGAAAGAAVGRGLATAAASAQHAFEAACDAVAGWFGAAPTAPSPTLAPRAPAALPSGQVNGILDDVRQMVPA